MEKLNRNYPFSDMSLIQRSELCIRSINRDASEFAKYGFAAEQATDFVNLISDFKAMPDDSEFDLNRQELSMVKNQKKDNIAAEIRNIKVRLKLCLSANHPKLKRLQRFNLSRLNDQEMLQAGLKAVKIASQHKSQLEAKGYLEANLTNLKELCDNYDDLIDDLAEAHQVRDEQREIRVGKGNLLYAQLVEICEIGRVIWQNDSEAKYNDYIIHESSAPKNNENEEEVAETNEEIES